MTSAGTRASRSHPAASRAATSTRRARASAGARIPPASSPSPSGSAFPLTSRPGVSILPDAPLDLLAPKARQRPVRPRHAASLIVLRHAPGGLEILMGTRGAKARFMPNRLVFPGGAVDRADYRAKSAPPLPPHTADHLQRGAPPRLAHALAVAAARELE